MARWDAPGNMDCAQSWMPSSISCERAAPGVRCPTGRHRAARSTNGSAAWPTTAGWRRFTMPCSWRCASFRGARPAQPSASSTARRSRSWLRLGRAAMTTPRKSMVASATSWWTVWLVDSLGHLLAVLVTDGAVQDRDGGIDLVRQIQALFPWIVLIVADSAYPGLFTKAVGVARAHERA